MRHNDAPVRRTLLCQRTLALGGSALLAAAATVALAWLLSSSPAAAIAAPAQVWRVCPVGSPTCDYATVQEAVDAARSGDVIKVAGGAYTDVHARAGLTQAVYITKSVTIRGGYTAADWETPHPDAHPTTLDAGSQGRVAVIRGAYAAPVTVTLEGLQLTGGRAPGEDYGGGIYAEDGHLVISACRVFSNGAGVWGGGVYLNDCDGAVVHANQIYSNTAEYAAGLHVYSSHDTRITDNQVHGNQALNSGGGIYLWRSRGGSLSHNEVYSNVTLGGSGGGIVLNDSDQTTLAQNRVFSNVAKQNGGGIHLTTRIQGFTMVENDVYDNRASVSQGGGVSIGGVSDAMICDNRIAHNTAGSNGGGFLLATVSRATLARNVIISNTARRGGAAYLYNTAPFTMVNNVLADNAAEAQGGGLYLTASQGNWSRGDLIHNTLAGNRRGQGGEAVCLFQLTTLTLTNNLIAGHEVGLYARTRYSNAVSADHTLFYDNDDDTDGHVIVSTNAITGQDPRFADPIAANYHILARSPAIDAGIDVPWLTSDVDRDLRPRGAGYDVGADEAGPVLTLTKAGPAWANPGALITYTLYVGNGGALTATTVLLTDTLPAGSAFAAASHGGTQAHGAVTWPAFEVAPDAVVSRILTVTAVGTITNADYRASAQGVPTVFGAVAVRTARNHPPQANAGPDQVVEQGEMVTLTGGASSDPDGHALTFRWTQTGGAGVALSDEGSPGPTFTAPHEAGVLTFTLTVSDPYGLSDVDAISVTVSEEARFVYLPLVLRAWW
jgi:uncharacterized repeat protein (TIGR01451 family)